MSSPIVLATRIEPERTIVYLFPEAVADSFQSVFESAAPTLTGLRQLSGPNNGVFKVESDNQVRARTSSLSAGVYELQAVPTDERIQLRVLSIALESRSTALDQTVRVQGSVIGPDKDAYAVHFEIHPPCFSTEYAATMARGVFSVTQKAGYRIHVALVERDPVTGELGTKYHAPELTIFRKGSGPFPLGKRSGD